MARRQRREVGGFSGEFVNLNDFDKGDTIAEGVWTETRKGKFGPLYVIADPDSGDEKVVPASGTLKRKFEDFVEPGDFVEIVYNGMSKIREGKWRGQEAHDCKVYIDDDVVHDLKYRGKLPGSHDDGAHADLDDDEDDDPPKRQNRRSKRRDEDDEDDDPPKRQNRRSRRDREDGEDEDEDDAPRRTRRSRRDRDDEDDDDPPKRQNRRSRHAGDLDDDDVDEDDRARRSRRSRNERGRRDGFDDEDDLDDGDL